MEVLPAPFGPMIANNSLPPTVNDTPSMAFTPAKDSATQSNSSTGVSDCGCASARSAVAVMTATSCDACNA
jgi:hypothetical protein